MSSILPDNRVIISSLSTIYSQDTTFFYLIEGKKIHTFTANNRDPLKMIQKAPEIENKEELCGILEIRKK